MDLAVAAGPQFRRAPDGASGDDRFWMFHPAASGIAVRGTILAVHAFAEELNKTRVAVADGARALAAAGYAVLLVDLKGCGDSAGEFGDASWNAWIADLDDAWRWLASMPGPRWLWGVRLGALLADDFASMASPPVDALLLWQPVVNGAQHLGQFLRLKTIGNLLRSPGSAAASAAPSVQTAASLPTDAASPRAELASGRAVEIAGYRLTPALADAVEGARLGTHEGPRPARVHWFEVSSQPDATVSPIATRVAERWRGAGAQVEIAVVAGPAFWQTQEVERCDALVVATVAALSA